MTIITEAAILETLSRLAVPGRDGNLVAEGMVSNVIIRDGGVVFSINIPSAMAQAMEPVRQEAEKLIKAMPGVERAAVVLTAEQKAGDASQKPAPPVRSSPGDPSGGGGKAGVPGIKHIVAVASGKGGVGKSTTSVNLTLSLLQSGLRVGILDADIYGPSLPRLLGISGKPTAQNKVLIPMEGYGLKVMSMGFLVEEEAPMIWRGPMVI